jgi:hypothetical protein
MVSHQSHSHEESLNSQIVLLPIDYETDTENERLLEKRCRTELVFRKDGECNQTYKRNG